MNNTLPALVAAGILWTLDHVHISAWIAAPAALALGYFVARTLTRQGHGR